MNYAKKVINKMLIANKDANVLDFSISLTAAALANFTATIGFLMFASEGFRNAYTEFASSSMWFIVYPFQQWAGLLVGILASVISLAFLMDAITTLFNILKRQK
jgi:hypothetical protein